ncbi:hypothetical protein [Clostridium tagluense]|uniref:hypothetical protein n=1 Tax=Clostridium tagluense TaxID=360422 RepID=UPI001CF2FE86|nr:hypothetical protein [Clostridium tagluense]MCB2297807.1 hypothetical protein [Clostridium tagluense]
MAIFSAMSITNAGKRLYTKAQAGKPIIFTKLSIGSGQIGTQNPDTLNALIQPQYDVAISSITQNTLAQSAAISGTIKNTDMTKAIYICELGLWATDPDDGLILYGYTSAGLQGDYMAPATQGAYAWMYQINAAIGNAANVTANISSILYDYSILGTATNLTIIKGGNQKALNESIDKEIVKLNASLDSQSKKVELYIAETLPIISDRKKNTMYLKVTSTLDSGTSNNLKVSPAMGIKIVQEEV